MTQEKFKIYDNSGDRKYFSIIPHYIVNHSTMQEQALYLNMKRIAGENGTCWASPATLAKSMGTSSNTIRKYRDKLLKRGWIKKVGERTTGATRQLTNEYEIVDLWEVNVQFYSEKQSIQPLNPFSQSIQPLNESIQPLNGKGSTIGSKEERVKKKEEEEILPPSAEKNMITHNDNDFSDSGDPVIQEGEEVPTPKAHARQRLIKAKGYDPALTNELLQWAIDHTSQRYSHPMKQKAHIAAMLAAGRTQEQIVSKWLELEQDEYWREKGIDFSIVASQIDKQKKRIKQNITFS